MKKRAARTDREKIESLIALLADEDDLPTSEEARERVTAMGLDSDEVAASIKERIERHIALATEARIATAAEGYERAAAKLASRAEPLRPRDEQLAILRGLIDRAGPRAVAVHFRNFEEATDQDLAQMIATLRHLLGEDDPSGEGKR